MYRRLVSLLLLPCLLLTQSAALGHAHGGATPVGHESRPHFHTVPASAAHSHSGDGHDGHSHGHAHHRHPHTDADDVPGPDLHQVPAGESPSDHDSTAVYTTSIDLAATERSSADSDPAGSSPWADAWLNQSLTFFSASPPEAANRAHPPPDSGYSCPRYVRHLTLLI